VTCPGPSRVAGETSPLKPSAHGTIETNGGIVLPQIGSGEGFVSEYAPHRGRWSTTASGAVDGRTADAVPQPKRGGTCEWRTKHQEGKTQSSSDGSCGSCSTRTRDGRWPLDNSHPDPVPFDMEGEKGTASRWNTLRALRVLDWYSARN
jgi:hypothetical protein